MSRTVTLALVLFGLVTAVVLFNSTVFAAGGVIEVLSNEREVRFPVGVNFNLEVESEADIQEVRLYYRVTPSGPWTYAYPNVTPSWRVETNFNLNISGVSYLPPGTEVEYYYSITDADGNTLETEIEIFLYVDGRFRWQTIDVGPLTLYWHDLPRERVRDTASMVENSLYEIAELLDLTLDKQVRGIIYNNRSEANEAFPNLSRTTTEREIFQGFAYPERGVFVGLGLYPGLIVHESAHLLLDMAASSPLAAIPAWVNEGFASYVEPGAHGSFPRGVDTDYLPLRHMDAVPGRPADIRYFYTKAESVVGYLLETYGDQKFRGFIARLNEGEDSDTALMASYGFSVEELDQEWASPQSRPDASSNRSNNNRSNSAPFASFNTVLIAMLPFLVIVALLASFVVRRLKRETGLPVYEERLTEEEWAERP